MGKGIEGAILRGLGAREHVLTVTSREDVTDHYVRIGFESDTLLNDAGEVPAAWVRAWFPDPGGRPREHQRGYTLVDPDPAAGTFAIEFVLHEPAGPASTWARTCRPGDRITAMRYGEHDASEIASEGGQLLVGDLAALPAIRSIAAAVPADVPVTVVMERHGGEDRGIELPSGPNVTATWVDASPDGRALERALDELEWTAAKAWVTAEATATRHARSALRKRHGMDRRDVHAQGYWVRGRGMGRTENRG